MDDFQKDQAMRDIYLKNIMIQQLRSEVEILNQVSNKRKNLLEIATEGLKQAIEYNDISIVIQTLKELEKELPKEP
tara:strand:+ start:3307 stop:3534 length:228 start_codon:yes stop_codon:yes gene_type:complete